MSKNKNQKKDFHNKNQKKDFRSKNQIDFRNKIIPVPEAEYYDKAETKPKFCMGVHANGSLSFLEYLNKSGKWHGLKTHWHENGQKSSEVNYVNGKRHGPHTWWYANGNKNQEDNYASGKLHGLCTDWYKNGQKYIEGNYVNGQEHGEHVEYDKTGKLKKTSAWDNGKIVKEPAEEVQPEI